MLTKKAAFREQIGLNLSVILLEGEEEFVFIKYEQSPIS
jgi:hypothetical protein